MIIKMIVTHSVNKGHLIKVAFQIGVQNLGALVEEGAASCKELILQLSKIEVGSEKQLMEVLYIFPYNLTSDKWEEGKKMGQRHDGGEVI